MKDNLNAKVVAIYLEWLQWIDNTAPEHRFEHLANHSDAQWYELIEQFCNRRKAEPNQEYRELYQVPIQLHCDQDTIAFRLDRSSVNSGFNPAIARKIVTALTDVWRWIKREPKEATAYLDCAAPALRSTPPLHPYHYWVHKCSLVTHVVGVSQAPETDLLSDRPLYLFGMLDKHNREMLCRILCTKIFS